eukprot:gene19526-29778_t
MGAALAVADDVVLAAQQPRHQHGGGDDDGGEGGAGAAPPAPGGCRGCCYAICGSRCCARPGQQPDPRHAAARRAARLAARATHPQLHPQSGQDPHRSHCGRVSRAEARRLWRWVRGDPCGLRVATFVGSVLLLVAGVLGVVVEAFNRFRFAQLLTDLYSKESGKGNGEATGTDGAGAVLGSACGKAAALLFAAVMSASTVDDRHPAVDSACNIAAAAALGALSVAHAAVSCDAGQRAMSMGAAGHAATEHELRAAFAAAAGGARELPCARIGEMLRALDPPCVLSAADEHAALQQQLDPESAGAFGADAAARWWLAA